MRRSLGGATVFILLLLNNVRDTCILDVVPSIIYGEQLAWPLDKSRHIQLGNIEEMDQEKNSK